MLSSFFSALLHSFPIAPAALHIAHKRPSKDDKESAGFFSRLIWEPLKKKEDEFKGKLIQDLNAKYDELLKGSEPVAVETIQGAVKQYFAVGKAGKLSKSQEQIDGDITHWGPR